MVTWVSLCTQSTTIHTSSYEFILIMIYAHISLSSLTTTTTTVDRVTRAGKHTHLGIERRQCGSRQACRHHVLLSPQHVGQLLLNGHVVVHEANASQLHIR